MAVAGLPYFVRIGFSSHGQADCLSFPCKKPGTQLLFLQTDLATDHTLRQMLFQGCGSKILMASSGFESAEKEN
ncbi:tryptophan synthase alpha chain [Acetobacter aceti NRIC 0242]|nr:tryptophan synthase alpha chain [Acetobacter aceti NRIC 0242]